MYTKFEERMIGKRVREIETGDEGIVLPRRVFKTDGSPLDQFRIAVLWSSDDQDLSICLDKVMFIEPIKPEEITINGKHYKLVPIE